jgi:hypothetical protein
MDSLFKALGVGIGVLAVVIAVVMGVVKSGALGKARLPAFAAFGALPLADLAQYYALRAPPIAWEKVRGWDLNQVPPSLTAPGPIDHVILTAQLLDFCSGSSGKLVLVFNFLVEAILQVEFNPNALTPGTAPDGHGLITVHTPSGRTLLIASSGFAQALEQSVAQARSGSYAASY